MTGDGDAFPADRLNRLLTAVETIEESLGVLARKQCVSREDYKADSDTRDIVERRFVKMTEAAIDIAEELVKHERGQPPASNPESMRTLGEMDVLSGPLAEEMAQGARFRNVLSHTYGNIINHDVVYNALQDLDRYRAFVQAVRDHLESIGVLDG
ncbi:type VII toxin-antitoxin system HepT family RNase toxin [Natrinema sp. 74]|uniref:type VII toxin-antitoxin system HepT family RNase toxin n=1 Tax=Natrinema sp. 74 TaxID=3384159 RepID=UPI0038D4BC04